MYIIISKTQNKTTYAHGNFPNVYSELDNGNDIIIVSLYSNTIKVPYIDHEQSEYGDNVWEWKEYKLDLLGIISNHLKK